MSCDQEEVRRIPTNELLSDCDMLVRAAIIVLFIYYDEKMPVAGSVLMVHS